MIKLSNVLLCNIDNKIYALSFFKKIPYDNGDVECINNNSNNFDFIYYYKDILDNEVGKIYQFNKPVHVINSITYYMNEEEISNYMNDTLADYKVYNVIARAIKYEQSKINEIEQDRIKKLIKSEYE